MTGGIINLIMILLKPLLSWKILFHLFFHRIFRPRFYARIMLREGGLVCTNGAASWSSRRIVLSEKTTGWEVFLIYHCYWVFSFQLGWYSNILMIFHYVLAHPLKKTVLWMNPIRDLKLAVNIHRGKKTRYKIWRKNNRRRYNIWRKVQIFESHLQNSLQLTNWLFLAFEGKILNWEQKGFYCKVGKVKSWIKSEKFPLENNKENYWSIEETSLIEDIA